MSGSDHPLGLTERLARIASLEAEIAGHGARAPRAPNAREVSAKRITVLNKQLAELERRVAKLTRARKEPLRVKNRAALACALGSAATFVVGLALQVVLWNTPLVWEATACTIADGGDNPDFAIPSLRPSATFHTEAMPKPASRVPCWIPSDARGDCLGRLTPPLDRSLSLADKVRQLYAGLMLMGLGGVGLLAWGAIEKPTED
ncbi:MAG TPA: hypothetical protein PLR99_18725 [Polyangiaceae bacterium]|nr:hypothetical protein [Polyangiaceae bacterium]